MNMKFARKGNRIEKDWLLLNCGGVWITSASDLVRCQNSKILCQIVSTAVIIWSLFLFLFLFLSLSLSLSLSLLPTHTNTYTGVYIYIYIYIRWPSLIKISVQHSRTGISTGHFLIYRFIHISDILSVTLWTFFMLVYRVRYMCVHMYVNMYIMLFFFKYNQSDKIKWDFFQTVTVSILLYRSTSLTLSKCIKKTFDGNYSRMLPAVLKKKTTLKKQLPPKCERTMNAIPKHLSLKYQNQLICR